MTKSRDYSGKRYGRLEAVAFAFSRLTPNGSSRAYWLCKCDCGSETITWVGSLQSGDIRSCGCLRRETVAAKNRRHGMSGTAEYNVWLEMRRRCLNPKARGWHNYGGRGITICEAWLNSFETFFADVGPRPTPDHSIERKEVDGNYEPENVVWATPAEQANNMRKSVRITLNGITRTVAEWSRLLKINQFTVYDRLDAGWDPERALTEPVRKWPSQLGEG